MCVCVCVLYLLIVYKKASLMMADKLNREITFYLCEVRLRGNVCDSYVLFQRYVYLSYDVRLRSYFTQGGSTCTATLDISVGATAAT